MLSNYKHIATPNTPISEDNWYTLTLKEIKHVTFKPTGKYKDETPFMIFLFNNESNQRSYEIAIQTKHYLTIQDITPNLNQVRLSGDEQNYLIDINTNKRLLNELKTNNIKQVIGSVFYCLGVKEGSFGLKNDIINRKLLAFIIQDKIQNIKPIK
jgi:hypothetical protein